MRRNEIGIKLFSGEREELSDDWSYKTEGIKIIFNLRRLKELLGKRLQFN